MPRWVERACLAACCWKPWAAHTAVERAFKVPYADGLLHKGGARGQPRHSPPLLPPLAIAATSPTMPDQPALESLGCIEHLSSCYRRAGVLGHGRADSAAQHSTSTGKLAGGEAKHRKASTGEARASS